MGKAGAEAAGISLADFGAITPAESASGILAVIESATKETHGGKFWSYDGSRLTY
jgi:norsolorinic acid ketoreductase